MKQNKIFLYTDGGGNPGSAAIGIIVCDENKNILHEYKECIGEATNNTAEYIALRKGLEIVAGICRNEICCFSDSELLVRQLNGSYRITCCPSAIKIPACRGTGHYLILLSSRYDS